MLRTSAKHGQGMGYTDNTFTSLDWYARHLGEYQDARSEGSGRGVACANPPEKLLPALVQSRSRQPFPKYAGRGPWETREILQDLAQHAVVFTLIMAEGSQRGRLGREMGIQQQLQASHSTKHTLQFTTAKNSVKLEAHVWLD